MRMPFGLACLLVLLPATPSFSSKSLRNAFCTSCAGVKGTVSPARDGGSVYTPHMETPETETVKWGDQKKRLSQRGRETLEASMIVSVSYCHQLPDSWAHVSESSVIMVGRAQWNREVHVMAPGARKKEIQKGDKGACLLYFSSQALCLLFTAS